MDDSELDAVLAESLTETEAGVLLRDSRASDDSGEVRSSTIK